MKIKQNVPTFACAVNLHKVWRHEAGAWSHVQYKTPLLLHSLNLAHESSGCEYCAGPGYFRIPDEGRQEEWWIGEGHYRFAGAIDDGSEVGIKHFAPSIIFVEEFCRINTGIVDAYVKLSEDVVVAGIGGSQLICITNNNQGMYEGSSSSG